MIIVINLSLILTNTVSIQGKRGALAVGDIIDCNRLPILKTKLIRRYINTNKETNQLKNTTITTSTTTVNGTVMNQRRNSLIKVDRIPSSSSLKELLLPLPRQPSHSSMLLPSSPSSSSSSLLFIPADVTSKLKDLDIASLQSSSTYDNKRISLREQDKSSNPHSLAKSDNSDNINTHLANVLQLMTEVKHVIDPSRLYYDAGNQFSTINMYDRAIYCYKRAAMRVSAAHVVDTSYLPCDDKYHRCAIQLRT